MTIDKLLKNPESLSKTYRTLLHDVEFELNGTVLSAVCRNHFEAELIRVVAGKLICEGVQRERGIVIPRIAVTPSGNDLVPSDMEASKFVTGPGARHPEYVLNSFLVDETNAVAFSAAVDLVDPDINREQKTRFLYMYGNEGCGKTHLLYAAVNGLAESGKHLIVFDGEEFAQYLITAASLTGVAREIHSMQLHEADGLAVDDIGPIAGNDKQKVQQEFASVLDDLGQEGKYGIFTGRYSPTDWHWKLGPDLSNRLMKGQPAEIEDPRGLMREKLAEIVFGTANLRPGQDIISFVADARITSIRTLLTLCYQLVAQAYGGREVTVQLARSLLRKLGVKKGATDEDVVTNALQAMGMGIQLSEMQGPKINRELKKMRNGAITRLVEDKKLPQSLVAGAFDISTQAVSKIVKGDKKHS